MSDSRYELTTAQAAFLETVRQTSPAASDKARARPSQVRFPGQLPPIADQAVRGTCVANAVAALVACYEGCRRRVSVQYLDEVTRLVEQAWVTRNLNLIIGGEAPEKDFEASFPEAVSQATLLVRANGVGSDAATAFVRSLGTKIRSRVEADAGCRLKRCFEALEEYGVCREELWPYSPVALKVGATGGDAVGAFPPGTHEDARRHRIVNGLYVLRAPNNVDEIKGILAGARGRRPMPVCVGLDLFEGRTEGTFELPTVVRENEHVLVAERPLGIHEVLLVASTDDAKSPGGGYFTFQNSWGRSWGEGGTGRVSYAYVACFCREAGTILQEPDDYGPGMTVSQAKTDSLVVARRRLTILCAVGICLFAAVVSVSVAVWSAQRFVPPVRAVPDSLPRPRPIPPKPVDPTPNESDEEFDVVTKIYYRFRVQGACDSTVEAMAIAYALDAAEGVFTFEGLQLSDDRHGFEGEIVIEGESGHRPADTEVVQKIKDYIQRKKLDCDVRKLIAIPLQRHRDKSNGTNKKKGKKHEKSV